MLGPLKNRFGSLPRPPRTLRLAPRRFLTHRVHSQLRLCVKPLGRFWTSGHSQRESFCITGLTSENAGVPTRNGARCRRALFVDIGSVLAGKVRPGSGPCAASAEAGRAMSGGKFPISPLELSLAADASRVIFDDAVIMRSDHHQSRVAQYSQSVSQTGFNTQ